MVFTRRARPGTKFGRMPCVRVKLFQDKLNAAWLLHGFNSNTSHFLTAAKFNSIFFVKIFPKLSLAILAIQLKRKAPNRWCLMLRNQTSLQIEKIDSKLEEEKSICQNGFNFPPKELLSGFIVAGKLFNELYEIDSSSFAVIFNLLIHLF